MPLKALDGTSRLNINIPIGLHKRLRQMALDLETNVTALIIKWATEKAEKHEQKKSQGEGKAAG